MSAMSGLDDWLLRGSGIYSTERDVTLDNACGTCGTTHGVLYVDDFGIASVECEEGHDQPDHDFDPDFDPDPSPHWDEPDRYLDDLGD